jgi:putative PIN family toxin of toxin-antitoxin system
MRIFFDTNVLIAAFLTRGASAEVFEYCLVHHTVVVSESVLEEFTGVMKKKFRFTSERIEHTVRFLRREVQITRASGTRVALSRDPDDDQILADATYSQSQLILSGDQDLLVLGNTFPLPILSPSEFWKFETRNE